jgi:hypothetical protein
MATTTTKAEKQAAKYTHSVWSGKRYTETQTVESLTAEGLAVLRGNAAIRRTLQGGADKWLEQYRQQVKVVK